jgi:2-polyprenyl-3-methyl-5-hydroxy-6-metoxy-1,4-benzoquinol methylase
MKDKFNDISSSWFAKGWLQRRNRWDALRDTALFPRIEHYIRLISPKTVLDAGCGDGTSTETILRCKIPCVYAGDVNPFLLLIAAKRLNKRACIIDIDLSKKLSLVIKFDLIVCISVYMFLDNQSIANSLREFRNHTTPEGYILISFVHPEWTWRANKSKSPSRYTDNIQQHQFPIMWDGVNANLYYRPLSWYLNIFSEENYHIIHSEEIYTPQNTDKLSERFVEENNNPVYVIFLLQCRR